jgi:hypothetical protein
MALHGLGAVVALQIDVAVAKLEVDLVLRPVALVVEHQRAAETEGVELAVPQEFGLGAAPGCEETPAVRAAARDLPEGEIEDRPQRPFCGGEGEIPADPASQRYALPVQLD